MLLRRHKASPLSHGRISAAAQRNQNNSTTPPHVGGHAVRVLALQGKLLSNIAFHGCAVIIPYFFCA